MEDLLITILTLPITVLYETKYMFVFGFLYCIGIAALTWIIDLAASPFLPKPKPVSVREKCLSQFPFDEAYDFLLMPVRIVVDGHYSRVFLSSEFLVEKELGPRIEDLIMAFEGKVSGSEFTRVLREVTKMPCFERGEDKGVFVLFLPTAIQQCLDFKMIGELLSQTCHLSIEKVRSFLDSLEGTDELTRDVVEAIDLFLRNPYNYSILYQPSFTTKIKNTFRRTAVPYIDKMIDNIENATVEEMVSLVESSYETRRIKRNLRNFEPTEISKALDSILGEVDIEEVKERFKRYFKYPEIVKAVKGKIIGKLKELRIDCYGNDIERYTNVTLIRLPKVHWLGPGTYAVRDRGGLALRQSEGVTP